ncbi:MAG: heavy-metal-associated domain-containing protein [Ginsengibacter sp.]
MRSLFFTIVPLIVFLPTVNAQKKAIEKAVIQTPNVQCEACKIRIDNNLKRVYGVAAVNADFRKKTVTVQWYSDRTNIEIIKTELANMGYDADDVTADKAYFNLPKTCRHLPITDTIPK